MKTPTFHVLRAALGGNMTNHLRRPVPRFITKGLGVGAATKAAKAYADRHAKRHGQRVVLLREVYVAHPFKADPEKNG